MSSGNDGESLGPIAGNGSPIPPLADGPPPPDRRPPPAPSHFTALDRIIDRFSRALQFGDDDAAYAAYVDVDNFIRRSGRQIYPLWLYFYTATAHVWRIVRISRGRQPRWVPR